MSQGCGKADNNGKTVSGSKLPCGTKLSYGVGKGVPKREVVHLCKECETNGSGHDAELQPSN
jgi:hypothetical protein